MTIHLLAAVRKVLDKLGKNGTAPTVPPPPIGMKSNNALIDKWVSQYNLLHEFYLIDFASSNIKKRRDQLKKRIESEFDDNMKVLEGATGTMSLHDYTINKQVKNASNTLKEELLADNLRKKGWKQDDITKLINDSKAPNKPAVTWSVSSNASYEQVGSK